MTSVLSMLSKSNGRLSVARVSAMVTFALWIFTWLYTLLAEKNYAHFEVVSICMLVLFFVVLCSKSIDSKLISVKGDERNVQKDIYQSGPRA